MEWCYSFRCRFYSLSRSLTLSGARADDHLWPSCWDCIGSQRDWRHIFVVFFPFFLVGLSSPFLFHSRLPRSPSYPDPTFSIYKYKQVGKRRRRKIPTGHKEPTKRYVCLTQPVNDTHTIRIAKWNWNSQKMRAKERKRKKTHTRPTKNATFYHNLNSNLINPRVGCVPVIFVYCSCLFLSVIYTYAGEYKSVFMLINCC